MAMASLQPVSPSTPPPLRCDELTPTQLGEAAAALAAWPLLWRSECAWRTLRATPDALALEYSDGGVLFDRVAWDCVPPTPDAILAAALAWAARRPRWHDLPLPRVWLFFVLPDAARRAAALDATYGAKADVLPWRDGAAVVRVPSVLVHAHAMARDASGTICVDVFGPHAVVAALDVTAAPPPPDAVYNGRSGARISVPCDGSRRSVLRAHAVVARLVQAVARDRVGRGVCLINIGHWHSEERAQMPLAGGVPPSLQSF